VAADRELRSAWLNEKKAFFNSLSFSDLELMNTILEKCSRFRSARLVRPGPKAPDFCRVKLDNDPKEILTAYFAHTSLSTRVQDILSRIHMGRRFGTDWIEGRWTFTAPSPVGTLGYLSGLAHELGHVLMNGERHQQGFREMALSEATAMTLEEKMISDLLDAGDLQEWHRYQRAIDVYNVFFFREEMNLHTEADDLLLDPKFVFRESLWTSHGYQAVNAAASLIRSEALGVRNANLS